MEMIGQVTSTYYSPTLDRSIAMALIENGRARMGETLSFPLEAARWSAPRSSIRSSTTRKERGRMSELYVETPLAHREAPARPGIELREITDRGMIDLRGLASDKNSWRRRKRCWALICRRRRAPACPGAT